MPPIPQVNSASQVGAPKPGGSGGKFSAPPPPDYMGLAGQQAARDRELVNEQTLNNRPNQQSPFASTTWGIGPDGRPTQTVGFSGPLAGVSSNLQNQLAQSTGSGLDFSSLGQLGTGDSARQQAIDFAYNQSASRLNPMFSQREDALRTRLLNQGLQEGSEAYNKAMGRFGQERNDAYTSAMASAVGQGAAAGQAAFQQNLSARQQGIEEMLRQRSQPLAELQGLQGLTAMPSFNQAGRAQAPNLLQAGGMQDASNFRNWQANQQAIMDAINSYMQLIGTVGSVGMAASDARVKTDIIHTGLEAVPGVPLVEFRYRPEMGLGTGLQLGVLAQDLARIHPEAVRTRHDGVLVVRPRFAPIPLE